MYYMRKIREVEWRDCVETSVTFNTSITFVTVVLCLLVQVWVEDKERASLFSTQLGVGFLGTTLLKWSEVKWSGNCLDLWTTYQDSQMLQILYVTALREEYYSNLIILEFRDRDRGRKQENDCSVPFSQLISGEANRTGENYCWLSYWSLMRL